MLKKTELKFLTFSKQDVPTSLQESEPELFNSIREDAVINCSPKHGGLFANCTNLLALFYMTHADLAMHFNEEFIGG
ncbi:hypothetical protein [Vibrio paucivorans]|uniref:Uncharacterized protein n=1 Tax=Vibrio paucivorans TaxID=2829489 RepID=A0A9X3CIE5_9VIBR|nr:hypothetical protein [Vibrio paucivorans]MCW8336468.1 hypothetical protein [Vibrio paucivorans]